VRKNTNKLDKKSVDEILNTLRHHLPQLQDEYGVRSLWLFGSYVRGEQRKRSDLDMLVELDNRSLSLLKFIGLENHLGDLLKIKVDLVEKDILKPGIGRNVLKEIVQI
jgi:predicted nucleotidyltransferase